MAAASAPGRKAPLQPARDAPEPLPEPRLAPEERAAQASAKAAAFRSSAAALRAARLEEAALGLEKQAAAHDKAAKAAELPPGKRQNELRAYVARCEKRVAAREAATAEAQKNLEDARGLEDGAKAELSAAQKRMKELQDIEHVERAMGEATGDSQANAVFLRRTQDLLRVLESGQLAAGRDMPDELVDSIAALHQAVQTVAPVQAATLDEPLESVAESAMPTVGGEAGEYVATQLGTEDLADEDMEHIANALIVRLDEAHNAGPGDSVAKRMILESLVSVSKGRSKGKAGPY